MTARIMLCRESGVNVRLRRLTAWSMMRSTARSVNREMDGSIERNDWAPRCSHMRSDESATIKVGGTGAS